MPNALPKPKKELLQDLYETQKLTTREIATLLGTNRYTVARWLHFYEIPVRLPGIGLIARGIQEPTQEELEKLIREQHLTYKEIGELFGVTYGTVFNWTQKHSIPRATSWERSGVAEPTKEELLELYNRQGMSLQAIARHFGISDDVVIYFFEKHNIQLRQNGFNGGRRFTCKDGHIVRSLYEQRVDNWLYEHSIEHIYEPLLPFDRRYRSDFLANGWYIEIWGIRRNAKYTKSRLKKLTQYKEHKLPLIEISEHHFDGRHNEPWARKLQAVLKPPS